MAALLFLFRLNPLVDKVGPPKGFRLVCSLEDPEADPRPEDWDDLEFAFERRGGESPCPVIEEKYGEFIIVIDKFVLLLQYQVY